MESLIIHEAIESKKLLDPSNKCKIDIRVVNYVTSDISKVMRPADILKV